MIEDIRKASELLDNTSVPKNHWEQTFRLYEEEIDIDFSKESLGKLYYIPTKP